MPHPVLLRAAPNRSTYADGLEFPRMDDAIDRLLFHAVEEAAAAFVADLRADEVQSGQVVSHYRVLESIGEGGMGIVCKAIDLRLDRLVALKFLRPSGRGNGQQRELLEREARAASSLNHPSICTVHDIDEDAGRRFIVMEYLDGETLKARLARGPMAEPEAIDTALAIASALTAAHARHIVHCDIKPSNIVLAADGGLKVLDFGIARLQRDASTDVGHTGRRGPASGTRAYMSPEQARGEEIDQRTDIFSLGAVLREMVAAPSPALSRVIATMMCDERSARYQAMTAVAAALRDIRAPRARRRPGVLAAISAAVVILAGAGSYAAWRAWLRPPVLTARDWILVGAVDNRTQDPIFNDVLDDTVSVQIGQSPFLTVFAGTRLVDQLKDMRRPADQRITPDVAREVCERAGIKAFVTGSIAEVGSRYVVRLDAVNARTGDYLSRQQLDVDSRDRVLQAIGQEASALRRDLGESYQSLQRFNVPVETATTSSLEALRAFRQGQALMAQGTSASLKAVPFFQRAIELDPDFAVAYARLGVAYENAREQKRSEEAARQAFLRRERVSERERYQIAARYYGIATGEQSKAIEAMEMWTQAYPADPLPHNALMAYMKDLGRLERAAEHGETAVRLAPASAIYVSNLAGAYVRLGQFDRAAEVCAGAVRNHLDNSTIHRFLHIIALVKGDAAGVAREAEWRTVGTSAYANTEFEAEVAGAAGRLREARELYQRAITLTERQGLDDRAAEYRVRLALLENHVGRDTDAAALARRVLADNRSRLIAADAAFVLAAAGDSGGAAAIDRLAQESPLDERLRDVWRPLIAGVRAIRAGHPASAIEPLRLLESGDRGDHAQMRGAFYLGEAYLATGSGSAARDAFQRVIHNRGVVVTSPLYALAHLGLARAETRLGATTDARAAYERFFEMWKDADADLPVMRAARVEYARLTAPAD